MTRLKSKFLVVNCSLWAILVSCEKMENITPSDSYSQSTSQNSILFGNVENSTSNDKLLAIGQTSAELASGVSLSTTEYSQNEVLSLEDPTYRQGGKNGKGDGNHGKKGHHGIQNIFSIDGVSLLTPNDTLLAIVESEYAGDLRGLHGFQRTGATITHYDASGNAVILPVGTITKGKGHSHSGKLYPKHDSLLATIAKTIIDYGTTGITTTFGTNALTKKGSIVITRTGDVNNLTESVTFNNYSVNGISISGSKTRVNTYSQTGTTITGSSTTNSTHTITLASGTVLNLTGSKNRSSNITVDANNKPVSGTIVSQVNTSVTYSDGTVLYSYNTSKPITEDVSCTTRKKPSSGTVAIKYLQNNISIDFGDGTCNNTITIVVNGVTTTKTVN